MATLCWNIDVSNLFHVDRIKDKCECVTTVTWLFLCHHDYDGLLPVVDLELQQLLRSSILPATTATNINRAQPAISAELLVECVTNVSLHRVCACLCLYVTLQDTMWHNVQVFHQCRLFLSPKCMSDIIYLWIYGNVCWQDVVRHNVWL